MRLGQQRFSVICWELLREFNEFGQRRRFSGWFHVLCPFGELGALEKVDHG
jgi:hypothetical protein